MTGLRHRVGSERPRVVVVGGGLSGLCAAIACVDGGAAVTLVEARPRLGGATWSFRRKGLTFDNGQHVHLRCCNAYQQFLERIGTSHLTVLQEHLELPVLAPPATTSGAPRVAIIRRGALPAPAHLAASLVAYAHLGLVDRIRLGRAAVALRRLDLADPALDSETFGSFLARHGQSGEAREMFWDLIGLPTTNLPASEVSLALAAKVFKTVLEHAAAGDIGWSAVPLQQLHADPAVQLLERSGAAVHSRTKVVSIETTGPTPTQRPSPADLEPAGGLCEGSARAVSVVTEDARFEADAFVLAVPHDDAASLLPAGSGLDAVALASMGFSPIVDVHIVFDRAVMPYQIAAGVRSPVQYVFDRTDACGLDRADGQCLAISISGAKSEQGARPEVLIERYTKALAELLPAARKAKVVDAVVTKEPRATFRGVPGTARLRVGPSTAFPNLFLAGAWTDTGWPATMEGAVRSGMSAAKRALTFVGHERSAEQIGEGISM